MSEKQIIRNHSDILLVIKRLALEIAENHVDTKNIYFIGLNDRGFFLANALHLELNTILPNRVLKSIQMDIQNNHLTPKSEISDIENSAIIIVDDVVNSGYTAMKSVAHFFDMGCKIIETAFFAQREHLNFPVLANYVGLSIATTLKDHVYFDNSDSNQLQIYLA